MDELSTVTVYNHSKNSGYNEQGITVFYEPCETPTDVWIIGVKPGDQLVVTPPDRPMTSSPEIDYCLYCTTDVLGHVLHHGACINRPAIA